MSKYGFRDNKIVTERVTTDDLAATTKVIGTSEIEDAAISAAKLASDAVETAKIKDSAVTIAKLESALQKGILSVGPLDVSGTTVWYVEFPFKVQIDKVIGVVTATLDATTNIQVKNAAGTMMTDGSFNLTSSEYSVGKFKSCSPSANNEIAADASMQIVSDGATSSGSILAVIHFTRKA